MYRFCVVEHKNLLHVQQKTMTCTQKFEMRDVAKTAHKDVRNNRSARNAHDKTLHNCILIWTAWAVNHTSNMLHRLLNNLK